MNTAVAIKNVVIIRDDIRVMIRKNQKWEFYTNKDGSVWMRRKGVCINAIAFNFFNEYFECRKEVCE